MCPHAKCDQTSVQSVQSGPVSAFRDLIRQRILKVLPSPHAELLLGMTVGLNDLNFVPRFNDVLISTGTIHVVVVSGYNISLVYNLISNLLGSKYKLKNFIIGISATFLYAVISGFQPPVFRAWLMGTILALGKYYGRSLDTVYVLLVTGALMLVFKPNLIASLSFQLSFLATLGLMLFYDKIDQIIPKHTPFRDDLVATLSAQVLVTPLISNVFGRVSVVSPLANMFVLWTVPIITILGFLVILVPFFNFLVFPFLDIFVKVLQFFSRIKYSQLSFSINSTVMLFYYLVLGLIYVKVCKKPGVYSHL